MEKNVILQGFRNTFKFIYHKMGFETELQPSVNQFICKYVNY